jgi:hypothetical protein
VRYLFGIGDLPLPTFTTIPLSLGREVDADLKHNLTFNIDDTGATNAALLNTLQGKGGTYAVWFVVDGELFGGNTGIRSTIKFQGRVIPAAKTELQTIVAVITFEGALPAAIPWVGQTAVGTA